ncbi:MAG: hypothetical protein ACTHKS_06030 [Gaiellaceae bacterium]
MSAARVVLVTLLGAALVLIGVEIAAARNHHPVAIANPCAQRSLPDLSGFDGAVQQIVLAGLDGAACRLGTSREALVLSIAGSSAGGGPRLDRHRVTVAVRAGLVASLHEADRRGAVPSFAVPLLERLIRAAPIEQLVRGGFSLRDLLG